MTERSYNPAQCVVFRKTREEYGALSNMAGGYPLVVDGTALRTSEALYQCFRYPHRPDIQRALIHEASPMTAKMKSRRHQSETRPDWQRVRIDVMRWCLRVKLAQHWATFGRLLESTGERPIVEHSRRDAFWGAKSRPTGELVGVNALGRLLMELRDEMRHLNYIKMKNIGPPSLPDARLLGKPILRASDTAPASHARGREHSVAEAQLGQYPLLNDW